MTIKNQNTSSFSEFKIIIIYSIWFVLLIIALGYHISKKDTLEYSPLVIIGVWFFLLAIISIFISKIDIFDFSEKPEIDYWNTTPIIISYYTDNKQKEKAEASINCDLCWNDKIIQDWLKDNNYPLYQTWSLPHLLLFKLTFHNKRFKE